MWKITISNIWISHSLLVPLLRSWSTGTHALITQQHATSSQHRDHWACARATDSTGSSCKISQLEQRGVYLVPWALQWHLFGTGPAEDKQYDHSDTHQLEGGMLSCQRGSSGSLLMGWSRFPYRLTHPELWMDCLSLQDIGLARCKLSPKVFRHM